MVEKCYFKEAILNDSYDLVVHKNGSAYEISLKVKQEITVPKIEFIIEFDQPIKAWRNHDYKWVDLNKERISNDYAPKILVLNDDTHVLSNKNVGLWEYNISNKNCIKWVLRHPQLTPLFQYENNCNRSFKENFNVEDFNFKLLFTDKEVPEFSRSYIPFSSILCFTDHCDFDTNDSLNKQLDFFNKNSVRVTKGFFLNHFSKREENSSFEHDKNIVKKFITYNHELAYHSLTQSLRSFEDAKEEFFSFSTPYKNIETWIDHGYQPYNYTSIHSSKLDESKWSSNLLSKNISNLWTYVDSGTTCRNIFNQINPEHFSINNILKNFKYLGKSRFKFIFRSLILFSGNEKLIYNYKRLTKELKKGFLNNKIKNLFNAIPLFFYCGFTVVLNLVSIKKRNKVFHFAKYSPLIFKSKINDNIFNMFQTLEVTDFESTFCKNNLNNLCAESGVIIAHCYFSSPLKYQKGKLFYGNTISQQNQFNFKYLKQLIDNKNIWNPTISELINYHNLNLDIEYTIDQQTSSIKVKNAGHTHIRYIKLDDKL